MTNKWNYERVSKCADCRWYSSSSCILLNEVLPIGVCEAFQKRGCDKEWKIYEEEDVEDGTIQ